MSGPPVATARRRIRWGFGDAVAIALIAIVLGTLALAVSVAIRHPAPPPGESVKTDAIDALWASVVQFPLMIGLAFAFLRLHGRRARDLGLDRPTWHDLRYVGLGVVAAIAVNTLVLLPTHLWSDAGHGSQQVGNDLQHASGFVTLVLALVIVLLAPLAEEMLFRGYILRSALRRWPAVPSVLVAGIVFALFHLGDPDTLPSIAGLAAFGTLSAVLAVRTRRLVPSIGLHMGFNLLGAVALLATK